MSTVDGVMTLTEFLLARIAEDEAVANAALTANAALIEQWWNAEPDWTGTSNEWTLTTSSTRTVFVCCDDHDDGRGIGVANRAEVEHIARWDPARVLAECEAKRRNVESCRYAKSTASDSHAWVLANAVLNHLALPYVDHAEFNPEWKPQ